MIRLTDIHNTPTNIEYDHCGNTATAVLETDSTQLGLCEDCLLSLKEDLDEFLTERGLIQEP